MEYIVAMASCGMIYIPSVMKIDIGIQPISRFYLRNLKETAMSILLMGQTLELYHQDGVRSNNIHTSFHKHGSGIQKLIRRDTYTDTKKENSLISLV
jgi:hypothetical protein